MTGTRVFISPSQAEFVSGQKMPTHATINAADAWRKQRAEDSSRALLDALLAYGSRHGLPNLSTAQCLARMRRFSAPPPPPAPSPSRPARWTAEEDAALRQMRGQGKTSGMIGYKLKRTVNAVLARERALKLRGGEASA